jgi:thermostable 8-oxoguanine DNA glycosylase
MSADPCRLQQQIDLMPELLAESAKQYPKLKKLIEKLAGREFCSLSVEDIYEIAKEKSPRRASFIKQNNPDTVRHVMKFLDATESDDVRIRLLISLDGVGIPTASAILAWTRPEQYGVIDVRAWSVLFRFGCVLKPYKNGFDTGMFLNYNSIIRGIANYNRVTPQVIDVFLYRYDKHILKSKIGHAD